MTQGIKHAGSRKRYVHIESGLKGRGDEIGWHLVGPKEVGRIHPDKESPENLVACHAPYSLCGGRGDMLNR